MTGRRKREGREGMGRSGRDFEDPLGRLWVNEVQGLENLAK